MESLKIAMLAPEFLPNWGGAGTYSILLARELSKTDEIHVFTTQRGSAGKEEAIRNIEEYFDGRLKIKIVSSAKERFWYNAIYQLKIAKGMPETIEKERYDIIHSNHAHMPDLGLKLRRFESNAITTVHTTITSQFRGIKESAGTITHMDGSEVMVRFGYPALAIMEKYYLAKSPNLIFVSDFIQREVNQILKKPAERTRLVRNGVDLNHFKCGGSAPEPGRVNIMFSGRLLALKGLNHLMEAFAIVRGKHPEAHLTLVGDGDVQLWTETALNSGIPREAITFTGRKSYEEMPNILGTADIFVLPSMSESMPLALLEAMACGKPSVASRVGGIPEIISQGENGFLVKAGDVKDLAGRLEALVSDPGLRKSMGDAGKEHIIKEFSLADMVKETREMFVDVSGGGK